MRVPGIGTADTFSCVQTAVNKNNAEKATTHVMLNGKERRLSRFCP